MKEFVIRSCRKGYTYDQDKAIRPEETVRVALERIKKSDKTLIKDFFSYDNYFGMPQWRINNATGLSRNFKGSNGKGVTAEQAQASCIMEFVERCSAFRFAGWFSKTWREFSPKEVLPLECLANSLNYSRPDRESVLEVLKDLPIFWAESYNYTTERQINIPKIIFETHTTGLAAGNTMEEAFLQAICECVERHVGAWVQWNRGIYPTIDPESIQDPIILDLIRKIEARAVRVILKDFSDFLGIPAIGAILIDSRNPDNIGQAIGVCTDKGKATIRALTEVGQGVLPEEGQPRLKIHTFSFYFDTYEEVKFLLEGEKRPFDKVRDIHDEDLKVELERCRDILAKRGMEIMCVNMTDEGLELPAVWVYLKNAHIVFKNFSLLYYVGKAYMACKQYEEALKCFEGSLEQSKIQSFVYFCMGLCRQALGNELEARAHYLKALELVPLYQDTRDEKDYQYDLALRIGTTHLHLREFEKAMEYFEQAKSLNKDRSFVYFNMARCHQEKGEHREALKHFLQALELSPADGKKEDIPPDEPTQGLIYYRVGISHAKLGEHEKALDAFERARAIDGDKSAICFQAGHNLVQMGRWREALEFYENILKQEGWEKEIEAGHLYFEKGSCHCRLGEWREALKLYETVLALEDWQKKIEAGHLYFEKGFCHYRLGDYGLAKESLIKSSELLPGECGAFNLLGAAYRELGEEDKAIRAFKEALHLRPDEWRNYHILGSTYARFGHREEGTAMLEKALELAPEAGQKNKIRESLEKLRKSE